MTRQHSSLQGKRIVVTRAEKQAEEMGEYIRRRGGIPYFCPVIEPQLTENLAPIRQAIKHLDEYAWVIFTSVNAVHFFMHVLQEDEDFSRKMEQLRNLHIAAIGPKTERAIQGYGLKVTARPEAFHQEALVEACKEYLASGMKILYPRAKMARRNLREQLQEEGILIDDIVLYETVSVEDHKEEMIARIKNAEVDVITFTSSSTVQHFVQMLEGFDWERYKSSFFVASIGPVTSETIKKLGFEVHIEAKQFTSESLIEAIEEFYQLKGGA